MESPLVKTAKLLGGAVLAFVFWTSPTGAAEYFVSPTGGNAAPFMSWDTAATNIQDAIDAASAGDVVWVTNGVYATGGKVMDGDLTNRVVLDKALTVQSVNGPFVTTIRGSLDPTTSTNGPLALRCAWVTNGASLIGFTLQAGGTRNAGAPTTLQSGGGAWCVSATAVLANCIIEGGAAYSGGGVYQGTLVNCAVLRNQAYGGAGTYSSVLRNCTVALNLGVGTYLGSLTNCIVYSITGNRWFPFPEYSG